MWKQIRGNCWIRGLPANGFFLFRGRDVAIGMNSVKILHAVRSAITAIAEHRVSPVVFIVSREVNSAFHPSGEVKSSTGLSDWGVSTCLG